MYKLPEEAASQAFLDALALALAEIRALVKELAIGLDLTDPADRARLDRKVRAAVERLAGGIVDGEFGKVLRGAMTEAAAAAGAAGGTAILSKSFTIIDEKLVTLTLQNTMVEIRNLLDEMVPVVNRVVSQAASAGKSVRWIADQLKAKVKLADGSAISPARAALIARSELHSTYRQISKAQADRLGIKHFVMQGPDDHRNEPVCDHFIGKVLSAEDWLKVAETVFTYGLHYGCRHSWTPVPFPTESELAEGRKALASW
jgi:hypothetical protein